MNETDNAMDDAGSIQEDMDPVLSRELEAALNAEARGRGLVPVFGALACVLGICGLFASATVNSVSGPLWYRPRYPAFLRWPPPWEPVRRGRCWTRCTIPRWLPR